MLQFQPTIRNRPDVLPPLRSTRTATAPEFLAASEGGGEAVANPLDNLTASPLVNDAEIIIL